MTVKKAKPAKKKSASRKAAKKSAKRAAPRKRASKKAVQRPYVEPKTAAELGIVCGAQVGAGKCGAPVQWLTIT